MDLPLINHTYAETYTDKHFVLVTHKYLKEVGIKAKFPKRDKLFFKKKYPFIFTDTLYYFKIFNNTYSTYKIMNNLLFFYLFYFCY